MSNITYKNKELLTYSKKQKIYEYVNLEDLIEDAFLSLSNKYMKKKINVYEIKHIFYQDNKYGKEEYLEVVLFYSFEEDKKETIY